MDFVKDENGVTNGQRAALISSDRKWAGKKSNLVIGVPLSKANSTGNNYRDFSKMQSVTYDVYNAGETALTITTTPMKLVGGYTYGKPQSTVVEAKTKATITYYVNRYEIFYALGMQGTTHINIGAKGTDVSLFVDNMRLHYIDDTFVEPQVIVDKDEIIGFEKSYQSFAVVALGSILQTEVVADASFASEGNRYVRVSRNGIADGVASYGDGKVVIPSNYLNKIDFSKYSTDAYIAYDYRVCWTGVPFWFGPRLVSSEYGGYANVSGGSLVSDNQWHTFYVPAKFMPTGFDTIELLFEGGTFGDVCFDNFRMVEGLPEDVDMNFVATKFTT